MIHPGRITASRVPLGDGGMASVPMGCEPAHRPGRAWRTGGNPPPGAAPCLRCVRAAAHRSLPGDREWPDFLSGTQWDGTGLDAEAGNGPVDLAIPERYNAQLETGTVDGPRNVAFPLTVTLQGHVTDRIRTTPGAGGAPIRVVTTNGPLTIRRAH